MDNKEKKNEQDMINTQVEPHNHRAIIGFDKNGVPKVLVPVSGHNTQTCRMKMETSMNTATRKFSRKIT